MLTMVKTEQSLYFGRVWRAESLDQMTYIKQKLWGKLYTLGQH